MLLTTQAPKSQVKGQLEDESIREDWQLGTQAPALWFAEDSGEQNPHMAKSSAITGELTGVEVKPTKAYTELETPPSWLAVHHYSHGELTS